MVLLEDAEWSKWSDREIARQCSVSPSSVAKYKEESGHTVHLDSMNGQRQFTHHKTGQPTTMKTANIGKQADAPTLA